MKKSKLAKNITTGFFGQSIALFLGILVPRIIITSYGSDANGLISTISQVFTYVALLEAGIGQAAKNMLYKPIKDNDKDSISSIVSLANSYFRRITIVYGLCVFMLSFILPFVLKTNISFVTVFLVTLFEGLSGVISFFFIQTPSIVIGVDGKSYINNSINLFTKVIGYIAKIIMASFGLDIVLLEFAFFIITIGKVLFYMLYFKAKYGWIVWRKPDSGQKLKDRNSFILTEICWTIFSSTDMIVLSILLGTEAASVYSVYNMIFANIALLVNAIYSSITYILGYAFNESAERYERVHDSFNSVFMCIITILMSVCYLLTIPFIKLYTKDISDVDYIYDLLPLLFCLIQMLSWSRYVSGNLTGIAGYAKQTSYVSLVEAIINIVLSIFFVYTFGLIGVVLATVIALPIKVLWCSFIADKKVMHRSFAKTISILGTNYMIFFGVVLFSKLVQIDVSSYFEFFVYGFVFTFVIGVISILMNYLVNKDCLKILKEYL